MSISQFSLKYRPRKWDDIYGQDQIVKALRKRSKEDDFPKATLLVGPYGTGKTTIAEILAACMQCHDENGDPDWSNPSNKDILNGNFNLDTQRLDGSQYSKKADVVDFADVETLRLKPMWGKKKVFIIEECDQIRDAALNSLLKVLEDETPWVHFILLSMDEKKGIPQAVRSRCQVFNVKSLGLYDTMKGLKHIMDLEGVSDNSNIPINFKLEGVKAIASMSNGSMRTAVQSLETCLVNEAYTIPEIESLLSTVDEISTWKILQGLIDKSTDPTMWKKIMDLKGDEIMHLYNYMVMLLSEAMLCKLTNFVYDDRAYHNLKRMGSNPEAERLFYILSLYPQMSKPYIKNSDLISALACYYNGDNFKPQNSLTCQNVNTVLGSLNSPNYLQENTNSSVKVRTRKISKI